MTIKTLQLDLGNVAGQQYQTGWYRDLAGQYVYFDAATGRWYRSLNGLLTPLEIGDWDSYKTEQVAPGDSLKIDISYKYSGPAVTGAEEYFSIGWHDGIQYRPKVVGINTRNLPLTPTPAAFTGTKTLVIPQDIGENWTIIECKVWRGTPAVPETGTRLRNALAVTGLVARITDFTIVDYQKV